MNGSVFQRWAPRMLSVLRMVSAFMFMANGAQKLFNYPPSPHPMSHLPPLMLVAGILECFGGLLLLLGLFTRPIAFVLAGEMATAYFTELAVLYCFVFLYFAVVGGGAWSVEQSWRRR